MNLVDFIVELEKKRVDMLNTTEPCCLYGQTLKNFEKQLFECDEFKNVVRINYIDLPSYLVDEESGEPISNNREFLGGKTAYKKVITYKIQPGEKIVFNKVVDLYSLQVFKIFNTNEDVNKPGVWVYPTNYDTTTFAATNQIKVIWDPNQLQEALSLIGNPETDKDRLKRMFNQALDSMEPNIPCSYALIVRCSERSTDAEIESNLTGGVPVVTSEIPQVTGMIGGVFRVND